MRAKEARLYWRKSDKTYIIRDGAQYIRTGCNAAQRAQAQEQLNDHLEKKYAPAPGPSPALADVLRAYLDHKPSGRHTVGNLSPYWADKYVKDVTAASCRSFAENRPPVAGRRDLETLRAAIRHWHKYIHPIPVLPAIVLPPPPEPRERWLSRKEMARLLLCSRPAPHLARFIIFGYYSGSRSGNILNLKWDMVDFERGLIRRRQPGQTESRTKRAPIFKAPPRLLAHLKRWKRIDAALKLPWVIHYELKPVRKLRRSWRTACLKANVKAATPHALRHTRVSELVSRGVSIWETAQSVGMSPLMVERVYGHLAPGWQGEASAA